MIAVDIKHGHITIDGHANTAPRGADIVCEAVTAISFQLINSLTELTDEHIVFDASRPGHISVKVPTSPEGFMLCLSFAIGIYTLSIQYPEHIHLTPAFEEKLVNVPCRRGTR